MLTELFTRQVRRHHNAHFDRKSKRGAIRRQDAHQMFIGLHKQVWVAIEPSALFCRRFLGKQKMPKLSSKTPLYDCITDRKDRPASHSPPGDSCEKCSHKQQQYNPRTIS